jgi:ribose transport system substrate-binding protein
MRKLMIAAALAALLGPMQSFAAQTKVTSGKTGMAKATEAAASYTPKKKSYYFVFAYKLIHPWYDAIKVGLDAAAETYKKKGITIKYDYLAPVAPDAIEQVNVIENAVGRKPDAIGVDITDVKKVVPVINSIMEKGIPVMTFAGGGAGKADGCNRIGFIGNVDNKGDGAKLAEELAKAINFEGEVAALDGTIGAPSHEQRIEGFNEVMAKYPKIKVVARQRDDDDLEKAVNQTENFLQKFPNLKGIWCNNMTNPIGAAQAVVAAGKKGKVVIVGMDHDRRTLNFVKDGTILAAQVQNNYDMGFFSIVMALKIADGAKLGQGIDEEVYNVGSTTVKQAQAQQFIDMLYGKK